MPFRPMLRLTAEEKQWNDYYTRNGKHGVIQRLYPATITIDGSHPTTSYVFRTSRRCRVYQITWSGDVNALKVMVTSATGETYTDQPCHIPLLSGQGVHSTLNANAFAAYPQPVNVPVAYRQAPAWDLEIEPNWLLPANKQLQFDYSLENIQDPALSGDNAITYTIEHLVCVWEFPGWNGDPRT